MGFQKAVKSKCKARVAVHGPSGSGKTMTALRVATGMGGKIGLIDSERLSASKYADRFTFDTLDLEDKSIEGYCKAIDDAKAAGIDVLIIDSLSHGWQELLHDIDKLANAKYKGNTWSAWSEGTPRQRKLVDAILNFPGHLIATMRSKMEWVQEQGANGKSRPVKVGLAPEQGKGIEYEFDILIAITVDHVAHIEKDRSGKFQDKIIEKPGEDFGKALAEWLSEGAVMTPKALEPSPPKTAFDSTAFVARLEAATDTEAIKKIVKALDGKDMPLEEKRVPYREAFLRLFQLNSPDLGWATMKIAALKQTTCLDEATFVELTKAAEALMQPV